MTLKNDDDGETQAQIQDNILGEDNKAFPDYTIKEHFMDLLSSKNNFIMDQAIDGSGCHLCQAYLFHENFDNVNVV